MSKNQNEKLENLRKAYLEEEKKIKARCDHRKKNGKLSLRSLDNGKMECKQCGEVFSPEVISSSDMDSAVAVLHDAINTIRIFSSPDSAKDVEIGAQLGVLNVDIKEAVKLYDRVVRQKGNNNERRNRKDRYQNDNDNNNGRYGLSFGNHGGGKKHKEKNRNGNVAPRYL